MLALADRACGDEKKLIDADIVERAIRLTEYFRVTAAKVQGHRKRGRFDGVAACRTIGTARTFTTAEGVAIAAKCGMSERSFKRFIKDRKGVLFVHSAHGNYTKL